MHEKLTSRMEHVIKRSQQIARDFDQDYVGTEHLLLAVLEDKESVGAILLARLGVGMPRTRTLIEKLVKSSAEDTWVFGRLPGTPHFRNVMAVAIEEARQLESKLVCTEHLLIALAREQGSVAQAALEQQGVRAGTIRAELIKLLDNPTQSAESSETPS